MSAVLRVFVSYSHDTEAHKQRVAELADRLRKLPIQLVIDRDKLPGGPDEGWPSWSERQVQDADQVLVVCTQRYCHSYEGQPESGSGLGAACEAGTIRQLLYDRAGSNNKFRAVLFEAADQAHIPLQLKRYHMFPLWEADGYKALLAWLTPQPQQAARNDVTASIQRSDQSSRALAISCGEIGVELEAQGKLGEAQEQYEASRAIQERVIARDPDNLDWRQELLMSCSDISRVLAAQGKVGEAVQVYCEATRAFHESLEKHLDTVCQPIEALRKPR